MPNINVCQRGAMQRSEIEVMQGQLSCAINTQLKAPKAHIFCLSLVLNELTAPILDPFQAWKLS